MSLLFHNQATFQSLQISEMKIRKHGSSGQLPLQCNSVKVWGDILFSLEEILLDLCYILFFNEIREKLNKNFRYPHQSETQYHVKFEA